MTLPNITHLTPTEIQELNKDAIQRLFLEHQKILIDVCNEHNGKVKELMAAERIVSAARSDANDKKREIEQIKNIMQTLKKSMSVLQTAARTA